MAFSSSSSALLQRQHAACFRSAVAAPRRVCGAQQQRSVTAMALKLYTYPRSRSKIIEWYLNELQVPFEDVPINMEQKEHKGEAFLAVNPFGKLPALQDGDLKLFESGAMLTYLADKYGGADTPEKRAEINKWVLFANATLGNALFLDQFREQAMPGCLQPLEALLSRQDYLLPSGFSAADVAVGAYLLYVPAMLADKVDLSPYPALLAYMERLKGRPECCLPGGPKGRAA